MRRQRICIPLPSRPPDYVPGAGPSLRHITLQLPTDSTAYIDDRILLPPAGVAVDGKPLPKRMKYIVGWRDLPAARLLVSAMDILDYVSPHTLEEWEYNMELELDEERERLEAERRALKASAAVDVDVGAQGVPKKRKRGRPPVHSKIETAAVAEVDEDAGGQGRLRGGAMSLSTPTKRKTELVEEYSSDESPSAQLLLDFGESSEQVEMSIRSATAPVVETQSERSESMETGDDRYRSIKAQFSKKPRLQSKIMLPLASSSPRIKTEPLASPQLPFPHLSTQPRGLVKQSVRGRSASTRPITDYLTATVKSGSSTPQSSRESPASNTTSEMRRPPQTQPHQPQRAALRSNISTSPKRKPQLPIPAQSRQTAVEISSDSESDSHSHEDPSDAWVVKRIEDMEFYDVEGRGLVRYFKVRWEGDWPADQNPTWEPEENLPRHIVRAFVKDFRRQPGVKTHNGDGVDVKMEPIERPG